MTYLGLVLLSIAWFVQLYYVWKGNRQIHAAFLIIYAIGIVLLIIDALMLGFNLTALLNFTDFVPAVLILWKLKTMTGSTSQMG